MDKENVVYIYTMGYYSAFKEEWKNAICSNRMDLEIITQSE